MNRLSGKRPAFVLALIVFSCAAFKPAAPYAGTGLGLQFDTPAGWSSEGEIGGGLFDEPALFVLPDSKEESSSQAVGITITSQALERAGAKDLSQVGNYFRSVNAGREYEIASEGNVTIGGLPAKQIVYTDTIEGVAEKVRHRQTYVFHRNRLLKIDFTSTESHFEAQWGQAKTFFDSLKFVS